MNGSKHTGDILEDSPAPIGYGPDAVPAPVHCYSHYANPVNACERPDVHRRAHPQPDSTHHSRTGAQSMLVGHCGTTGTECGVGNCDSDDPE